ncbi:hypothetical protein EX30DRAFT_343767 [Ascodesmis nigricans]|uniref:Uncharacterized protein n=1 Tax=Ascodesmis nigricans TaxID=341454 RepID=A0A4S2MLF6_9PEZI|nr:hypothetical protein EX30DRAFT_343767 [Ascodesmis nigricans]
MPSLSRALGAGLILLLTPVNADTCGSSFLNHQPPSPSFPATPTSPTFPSTDSASPDFGVPAIGDDSVFTPPTAPGFFTNIPIEEYIEYISAIAQDMQEGERYFTPFATASYDSDSDYDSESDSDSDSESDGLGCNYFYDSEFDMYTKVRHHLYQSVTTPVVSTPIPTIITTGENAKKQALNTSAPRACSLSQLFLTDRQCKIPSLLSPRAIPPPTPSLPSPNDRDDDFPAPVFTPQALAFASALRFLPPVKPIKRPIHLNTKLTTNPSVDQAISPLAVTLNNADYAQFHPDNMWRDKKVTLSEAYLTLSEEVGWGQPLLAEGYRSGGCRCEKVEEVDAPVVTSGASLIVEETRVGEDVKGGEGKQEQPNGEPEFRPLYYRFYSPTLPPAPPQPHQVPHHHHTYNSYTPFDPHLQDSTDLLKPREMEMGLAAVKEGVEKEVMGIVKEAEKAWKIMVEEGVKGRDPVWCNTGVHR